MQSKGWKSSEFWMSLFGMALTVGLPVLESLSTHAPAHSTAATIAPAVIAGLYAVSRGLAKQAIPPTAQQQLIETVATQVALGAINGGGKGIVVGATAGAVAGAIPGGVAGATKVGEQVEGLL